MLPADAGYSLRAKVPVVVFTQIELKKKYMPGASHDATSPLASVAARCYRADCIGVQLLNERRSMCVIEKSFVSLSSTAQSEFIFG